MSYPTIYFRPISANDLAPDMVDIIDLTDLSPAETSHFIENRFHYLDQYPHVALANTVRQRMPEFKALYYWLQPDGMTERDYCQTLCHTLSLQVSIRGAHNDQAIIFCYGYETERPEFNYSFKTFKLNDETPNWFFNFYQSSQFKEINSDTERRNLIRHFGGTLLRNSHDYMHPIANEGGKNFFLNPDILEDLKPAINFLPKIFRCEEIFPYLCEFKQLVFGWGYENKYKFLSYKIGANVPARRSHLIEQSSQLLSQINQTAFCTQSAKEDMTVESFWSISMGLGNTTAIKLIEASGLSLNMNKVSAIIRHYQDNKRSQNYDFDLKKEHKSLGWRMNNRVKEFITLYEKYHPDVTRDLVLPMAIDNDQAITYPPPRRAFAVPKPGEPIKGSMYIPVPPYGCKL